MSYNIETGLYEGYIYKIFNDINDKLYIGQTVSTIKKRFSQHTSNNKNNHHMVICNAIKKYGKNHFDVVEIKKICCKDKKELKTRLNKLEKKYIKKFNTLIPNGYNVTSGVDDVSEKRKIQIDAYTTNGEFIKSFNSCSEAAEYFNMKDIGSVSDCCKGNTNSVLEKKYTFRYYGEPFEKYNPFQYKRSKTIYQFDLDGNLINTFPNATIAGIECFEDKLAGNRISINLDKPTSLVNGYYWSSTGKFEFDLDSYRKRIKVDQYTLDGKFIKTFKSMSDASVSIGKDIDFVRQISECCAGKAGHAAGYIWRYHGDDFDKYNIKIRFRKITVDQYSKDGCFIATHESFADALRSIGITTSAISSIKRCCDGKAVNIYGYVWRYHGDSFDKYNTKPKPATNMKQVDQYDLNGKYIQTFDCAKFAGVSLGHLNGSSITEVCKGKQYSAFGFIWRYHGVPFDAINKTLKKKKVRVGQKINVYSFNNDFMYTALSAKELSKEYNCSECTITRRCSATTYDKTHIYKNVQFYYASDEFQPDKTKIIK